MQSSSRAKAKVRGTAVTETLLIMIPVWTFFVMIMYVMQYWERDHIDNSVEMESQFAMQTNSSILFDMGYKPDTEDSKYEGEFKFYAKSVSSSSNPGPTAQKSPDLPRYYFYITDQQGRKLVVYRGTSSWVPFIWVRGQSYGIYEYSKRKSWFSKMGEKTLSDNRQALMLGS